MNDRPRNVLGGELQPCSNASRTGFFRDSYCRFSPEDPGQHTVCARMTSEFLSFSKARGNDLMTPSGEIDFPGLHPGDFWCLCVFRWKEAYEAGVAPPVLLAACEESVLEHVSLESLGSYALDMQ